MDSKTYQQTRGDVFKIMGWQFEAALRAEIVYQASPTPANKAQAKRYLRTLNNMARGWLGQPPFCRPSLPTRPAWSEVLTDQDRACLSILAKSDHPLPAVCFAPHKGGRKTRKTLTQKGDQLIALWDRRGLIRQTPLVSDSGWMYAITERGREALLPARAE